MNRSLNNILTNSNKNYQLINELKKNGRISEKTYINERLKNIHFITSAIYNILLKDNLLNYYYHLCRNNIINTYKPFMNDIERENLDSNDNEKKNKIILDFFLKNHLYFLIFHFFLLPKTIYKSLDDMLITRELIDKNLDMLLNIEETFKIVSIERNSNFSINFPLSYQNLNNVEIFKKYCKVYRKLIPELNYISPHIKNIYNKKEKNEKIKIAFFSEYLPLNHSVTRDRSGIIRNLSRDIFDVYIIAFKNVEKKENLLVKEMWESIPEKNRIILKINDIKNSQIQISELELDILIFCEIGMSTNAYLLSYSKLAPIQCNTWGHSDTSGIDTIDYYISSKLYEIDEEKAKKNYSESLILTDHLCTYYYDPIYYNYKIKGNQKFLDRSFFGLSDESNIYTCLQSPFKITYEYDEILKNILINDEKSIIVMLDSGSTVLKRELLPRMEQNIGKEYIDRIKFFNPMGSYKFYSLISNSNICIDSYPFGGCNTTFECMSLNIPVVTLPSNFINGRFTYGIYKTMGIDDLIATDKNDYVNIAIKYANDLNLRNNICEKIKKNVYKIFEEKESVNDWNNLLENIYLKFQFS